MERLASLNSLRRSVEIWSENKLSDLQSSPKSFKSKKVGLSRVRIVLFLHRIQPISSLINFLIFRLAKNKIRSFFSRIFSARR